MHDAAPQVVDAEATLHAPLPLHLPSLPQGGLAAQRACGSVVPASTGVHVPALPATLQARQVAHVAVAQQTPSTQLPLSQSEPAAHA